MTDDQQRTIMIAAQRHHEVSSRDFTNPANILALRESVSAINDSVVFLTDNVYGDAEPTPGDGVTDDGVHIHG